jgi:acetyl-CoA acetyltransferase family protein
VAIDSGKFAEGIIPVPVPQKKGDPLVVTTDERPRRDTTMESLARLKPAFKKEGGTVTAGNSSGLNDGAAAVLVMSEEKAVSMGFKPLARIVSAASAGVEPRVMGVGPVPAVKKALNRAGLKMKDIGLVELNEAFAVQSIAVMEDLSYPRDYQCQRRGDCPRSPTGLLGGAHPDHAASRNGPTWKCQIRSGHLMCGRGTGGSDHR